jgi:hypothetical protein
MNVSSRQWMTGKQSHEGSAAGFGRRTVFLLSHLAFAFCLTITYLGMRAIMRLGGFVASGGPYAIAHPAPRWSWIMPVSFLVGFAAVFISFIAGSTLGWPSLMSLAWSALFLSTGWNFLEFGLHPPGGHGLAWGWLVCAGCFIPMGAVPLWFLVRWTRNSMAEAKRKSGLAVAAGGAYRGWGRSILLQLAAAALGIWLAILFFQSQARPAKPENPEKGSAASAAYDCPINRVKPAPATMEEL